MLIEASHISYFNNMLAVHVLKLPFFFISILGEHLITWTMLETLRGCLL